MREGPIEPPEWVILPMFALGDRVNLSTEAQGL